MYGSGTSRTAAAVGVLVGQRVDVVVSVLVVGRSGSFGVVGSGSVAVDDHLRSNRARDVGVLGILHARIGRRRLGSTACRSRIGPWPWAAGGLGARGRMARSSRCCAPAGLRWPLRALLDDVDDDDVLSALVLVLEALCRAAPSPCRPSRRLLGPARPVGWRPWGMAPAMTGGEWLRLLRRRFDQGPWRLG